MTIDLPMREIKMPAALVGQPNGQLPVSLLKITQGQGGGPDVRLCDPATRAFRALSAAASAVGITLRATSLNDSYRPLSVQQQVFAERYTDVPTAGWPRQVCDNRAYYRDPNAATAACPGHSNHGLGLAIDLADVTRYLAWLVENELLYGFSHELVSEPWHIHYFTGDDIPAAVLRYESRRDLEVDVLRYQFMPGIPGLPTPNPVLITDGIRYRPQPTPGEVNALLSSNGYPQLIQITAAECAAAGLDYKGAVAALCGTPDPGEQSGSGTGAHAHDVALTGSAQTFKGTTGPAIPA